MTTFTPLSYPELTCMGGAHKLHLEGQLDVVDADGASTGLQAVRAGVRLSSCSSFSQSADLSQQSRMLLTCITRHVQAVLCDDIHEHRK